jgi:hypothetical protein
LLDAKLAHKRTHLTEFAPKNSFRAGIGVRAVSLDSKGNLWVVSNMALDYPPPVIPDGVSIMKQFQLAVAHLLKNAKVNGAANMIRPDGTQPAPMGFTGAALNVPWGVNAVFDFNLMSFS